MKIRKDGNEMKPWSQRFLIVPPKDRPIQKRRSWLTPENRKKMPTRSLLFFDFIEGRTDSHPLLGGKPDRKNRYVWNEHSHAERKLSRKIRAKRIYPYMVVANDYTHIVTDAEVEAWEESGYEEAVKKSNEEKEQRMKERKLFLEASLLRQT